MKNRNKYKTFHEFILKDEKIVMKVLIVLSFWAGNLLFSLLTYAVFASKNYEIAIILSIFCVAGWWKLIRFYQMGGTKTMPKLSSEKFVWGKKG
jgi:hypothetical protein